MMKSLIAFAAVCLMGMGIVFAALGEPASAMTCLVIGMIVALPSLDPVRK